LAKPHFPSQRKSPLRVRLPLRIELE